MTSRSTFLAGVAAAALIAAPALAQTTQGGTTGTPAEAQQPSAPGQTQPQAGVIPPVPTPGQTPDTGAAAEEGATAEEAAQAEPTLAAPAEGAAAGAAGAGAAAPAETSSDIDAAIERADDATTGVTDAPGVQPPMDDADELGFEFEGLDESDESGMASGPGGGMDMQAFAREVFEQGYRQGYVAALTEMRMQAMREGQMRAQGMERAREQRAQERQRQRARVMVTQDENGNTILMLPPGVSAQDFLRQIRRGTN